jgi:hypothetical protein
LRFGWTPQFEADLARLSDDERKLFRKVAKEDFSPACDRQRTHRGEAWPRKLRVNPMTGTEGVWEMTWSFSGPDGRATFEWVSVEGEIHIRWRRIGGHEIFKNP